MEMPQPHKNKIFSGIIERQRIISLRKEVFRKSIHICASFVPFFLRIAYHPVLFLLISVCIFYTVSEILRLKGINIPLISKITEIAARKRDENKFVLGPVTLVLGILIASLFLPLEYATVGIFALAFGDGLASLVGKMIGKITIPGAHGKTVAGSLACFFAVFVVTFIYCRDCFISLCVATCAMFIEVLPLADFDNVIIPLCIGGIYMYLCV